MLSVLVRNVVTAGATAFALVFSQMDANPTLFMYNKFMMKDSRLDAHFQGKTMWITGASSGIGAELALRLSSHGVNLILSARPSSRLESVAEKCRQQVEHRGTGTVTVVPVDLLSAGSNLSTAVDSVLESLQGRSLDMVVLNAGKGQLRPAKQSDHDLTQQVFQVNALAPIALTQILLEKGGLCEEKGKHIVVTSSLAAKMGVPLSASYAASKHALHGYFNSLKAELPWLRIDLVCPGSTDTEFHQSHVGGSANATSVGATPEKKKPKKSKKLKMTVERCTSLLISSMMMNRSGEFWIAQQPVLLGFYVNQYFPRLFQYTLNKVGPLRVRAWEEGKDLYDPETWKSISKEKKQ